MSDNSGQESSGGDISNIVLSAALTAGFRVLFEKLAAKGDEAWKKIVARINIPRASQRMNEVRRVKTILSGDVTLDYQDFYCPIRLNPWSELEILGGIDSLDQLDSNKCLIQGRAGQGKSILMRHLFCDEVQKAERIPVFFELRRLKEGQSLKDALLIEIQSYGNAYTMDTLEYMLEGGMISLFLDGFDEVAEAMRSTILEDLRRISRASSELRLIVSSRPESAVENCTFLEIRRIDFLTPDEVVAIVKKLVKNTERRNKLIEGYSGSKIAPILTTPLMVVLLVLRFEIESTVPTSEIAFHENLFDLLLNKHDYRKEGYKRERHTQNLSDYDLRVIFCRLSLSLQSSGKSSFNFQDLIEETQEILESPQFPKERPDNVLSNITKITNLIVRDGDEYNFRT